MLPVVLKTYSLTPRAQVCENVVCVHVVVDGTEAVIYLCMLEGLALCIELALILVSNPVLPDLEGRLATCFSQILVEV